MMLELDELDETRAVRAARRARARHAPAVRGLQGASSTRRLARRFGVAPEDAAALALRRSRSSRRRRPPTSTSIPGSRTSSLEGLTERFFARDRLRHRATCSRAPTCTRSRARASTRSACRWIAARDIRVLCNVRPNEYWMGTMLHEFGHAVYDQHDRPRAAVPAARAGPHPDDRGARDAVRPAVQERGVAARAGPACRASEARARRRGAGARRYAPSCWCRRAGTW